MNQAAETITDKGIAYLFPASILENTPWVAIWQDQERERLCKTVKLFFPTAALLYLAHYWLFDLPMGLQPSKGWLTFRLGMVLTAVLAWAYYAFSAELLTQYRLVAALATWIFCVSQAYVTVIYPQAPWLYCFVFSIASAMVLRTTALKSIGFMTPSLVAQWLILKDAVITTPEFLSAAGVSYLVVGILRGAYLDEIRYFLLTQGNLEAQRKNIELRIEFSERIKFFVPKHIAKRMESNLRAGDVSSIAAIYEVLEPRRKNVACLFSDIRGFTGSSKELDLYVKDLAIPNIQNCTQAIEEFGGIPRKIGDLVFAYFDHQNTETNVLCAILAGLEISLANAPEMPDTQLLVKRYILISCGEAIVGNIGGLDSSVEITALGTPVNILSRLDDATKNPLIQARISSSDIILTAQVIEGLPHALRGLEITKIDLTAIGVKIRDFETERVIYCLSPTKANVEVAKAAMRFHLKELIY
jgi:class 3 adenylate cyclase